jgi:hypothetical protein
METDTCLQRLLSGIQHYNATAWGAARDAFWDALALDPARFDALHLLGLTDWRVGLTDRAVTVLRRGAVIDPLVFALPIAIATALEQQGHEALIAFWLRRALLLDPAAVQVWLMTAQQARRTGEAVTALAAWRRLARIRPDHPSVRAGLAGALRDAGRVRDALTEGRRAVALAPDQASSHHDLALMLDAMPTPTEAITVYRRAVCIAPDFTDAQVNLALRLLSRGELSEGWERYEWRLLQDERAARSPQPPWRGEDPTGQHVLVWGEQGVGDEIMFASCVPDLIARRAVVTVACEDRLVPLLTRSFPDCTARSFSPGDQAPSQKAGEPTFQVAIGSLPRWLRPELEHFPRRDGYLTADADEKARLRHWTAGLGGPVVGLSWNTTAEERRSIPVTDVVAALPGAALVSLQYGDHDAEERTVGIHRAVGVDPLTDLDRYAALIAALDLVVTIDNTTAHLAGALGVPTWILLPTPANWRWFGTGSACPWYPQARLFRQERSGDWRGVLAEVAASFRALAAAEPGAAGPLNQ